MNHLNKSGVAIFFAICLSFVLLTMTNVEGFATQAGQAAEPSLPSKLEHKKHTGAQVGEETGNTKKESSSADEKSKEKAMVDEEQDLMEKALELLDMADGCWKKGDIENALNYLDKAYALVLDTNGDVEISRQKDDLRLLISKRIVAIYSTQNTKTNGKASEIQQQTNADVEKEIKSFQTVERDFFIASYQRSGLYRDIILEELRKAGMPEELFWLPLVESGFKVSALSPARALGLWQFIPSTGYKYGLTRDEWMDERMDVVKSTRAAIAYLKELHGMFGDWLTVLAAYNCGEGRVLRVISRQHINYFDRFWDLYRQLPNETARYVPRFLATLQIIKDPSKYGFDLKMSEPLLDFETVKVNKMMKLSDIASRIETSEELVYILNAELRHKTTPDREYEMRIPKDALQRFNMVYADIPEVEKPRNAVARSSYLKHRVRTGETVASIAKRYKVSPESIYENNRVNKNKKLVRGQIILIPVMRSEIHLQASARQVLP
jgi:membrane-bound lytic murein transglycosylase D